MNAEALAAHLRTCATTVCRAWAITRRDGVLLGFTDHDEDLSFEEISFSASSGLSARAFEQTTGLAVDNTEAVGVLSNPAIKSEDIRAGRFDGAEVRVWSVNWTDVEARRLVFRGSLGEIERSGQMFRAELRGLADQLGQSFGRYYQRKCGAVLGDAACGVELDTSQFTMEGEVLSVDRGTVLRVLGGSEYADGWFTRGPVSVVSGLGAGDRAVVKRDWSEGDVRAVELWDVLSPALSLGDRVKLVAGCDKRSESCQVKFSNFNNFRGFPDIPGEDWLVRYPTRAGQNSGGSRRT